MSGEDNDGEKGERLYVEIEVFNVDQDVIKQVLVGCGIENPAELVIEFFGLRWKEGGPNKGKAADRKRYEACKHEDLLWRPSWRKMSNPSPHLMHLEFMQLDTDFPLGTFYDLVLVCKLCGVAWWHNVCTCGRYDMVLLSELEGKASVEEVSKIGL